MFELSNHLGNVLVTVSDRKLAVEDGSSGNVDYYTADVSSFSDYYPFVMQMVNRASSTENYRHGFNGMEKDDEMYGAAGSSYDFGARLYDGRIGRWHRPDALKDAYPATSTYTYVKNNPIIFIDPDGQRVKLAGSKESKQALIRQINARLINFQVQLVGNEIVIINTDQDSPTSLDQAVSQTEDQFESTLFVALTAKEKAKVKLSDGDNTVLLGNTEGTLDTQDIDNLAAADEGFGAAVIGAVIALQLAKKKKHFSDDKQRKKGVDPKFYQNILDVNLQRILQDQYQITDYSSGSNGKQNVPTDRLKVNQSASEVSFDTGQIVSVIKHRNNNVTRSTTFQRIIQRSGMDQSVEYERIRSKKRSGLGADNE